MFKIITIPFDRNTKSFDEDLLNRLVVNKQVTACRAELFHDGSDTYWTVFLDYDPLVDRPEEKETLGLDEPGGGISRAQILFDKQGCFFANFLAKKGVSSDLCLSELRKPI